MGNDQSLAGHQIIPLSQPPYRLSRQLMSGLEHVFPAYPHPLRSQPALQSRLPHPIRPLLPLPRLRLHPRDLLRRPLGRSDGEEMAQNPQWRARLRRPPALLCPVPRHRHPSLHAHLRLVRRAARRRHPAARHRHVRAGRGSAILLPELEHLLLGCHAGPERGSHCGELHGAVPLCCLGDGDGPPGHRSHWRRLVQHYFCELLGAGGADGCGECALGACSEGED